MHYHSLSAIPTKLMYTWLKILKPKFINSRAWLQCQSDDHFDTEHKSHETDASSSTPVDSIKVESLLYLRWVQKLIGFGCFSPPFCIIIAFIIYASGYIIG